MRKQTNNPAAPEQQQATPQNPVLRLFIRGRRRRLLLPGLLAFLLSLAGTSTLAQRGGGSTLFGDFKVDESQAGGLKPLSFDLILYTSGGQVVGRQKVSNNGRFSFRDVLNGEYDLVVEMENSEVARIHILLTEPVKTDVRKDISLEWREKSARKRPEKAKVVPAADVYSRPPANQAQFDKAERAIDKKAYDEAVVLLRQIVGSDPKDFQAWTELGTVYLMLRDAGNAEKAYLRATEAQPSSALAFINLGRLRLMQKNYEGAIEILTPAVKLQPPSAGANYYLGEAYLQIKKGSKAVGYLNEALRLDPVGMAEAHLRLAALYNGAGLKDKAAEEYEKFLAKRPDYPDKKRLQQYIAEHKKP